MIFFNFLYLFINLSSASSMRQNWHETRNAIHDSRNLQQLREKLTAPSTRRKQMDEHHQRKLAKIRSFGQKISLMQRRSRFN